MNTMVGTVPFLIALGILVLILLYNMYVLETIIHTKPRRIGYVSTNVRELRPILKEMVSRHAVATKNVELIELGAGPAKIAGYLGRQFHWKKVTAVELHRTLTWYGRLRALVLFLPTKYWQGDLFSFSIPAKAVVYCYLSPSIMKELYETGGLRETFVLSLSFPIPGVVPIAHVQLKNWQHELFVYDFRGKK